MIQRIQTIHLLLSVLIGIVALAMLNVHCSTFSNQWPMWAYIALTALGVVLAAWSIFLYKKRLRQISVVRFSTLAFALGVLPLLTVEIINGANVSWRGAGALLPAVCIMFNVLAVRRIRFDENLVRSADRLR